MRERLTYDRKCYTIADYYISYKEYIEPDTQYDVDLKTFKAIVTDYFKYIRDEVMYNCKEFKLPCRLGKLSIVKHQPKEFTGKSLRWDWKATKELGKPVYLLNEHSGSLSIDSIGQRRTAYSLIKVCISLQLVGKIKEIWHR